MHAHTGHAAGRVGTMSNHKLILMCNGSSRAELSTGGTLTTHQQGTIWGSSNDGSGSGLDADTLDGQQGSYYSNYNNLSNKPTIPTNNNQLTNGAGYITSANGGNAATLDGIDSSQFLRSDTSDQMNGELNLSLIHI